MIYLTALGALHRPQVFNSSSESTAGGIDQQNSRQKITDAAIAMTGIAYDLQTRDQLRYLSTSSIPAFLSATLIHLLDIRSPNEQARNVSIGRFYQCLQALHRLQEMYASADYAVQFLKSVLKKTDVYIPMLDYELGISRVPIAGERNWSNSMQPSHISVDPQTGMMAYPTPSSSNSQRDLPANADMYDRTNTNANGCETAMISGDGGATMQFPIEGLGLFPQLEDWGDANGLLPALITSDADPTWFLSNNGNLSHLDTM
jgi:hypothetical protein